MITRCRRSSSSEDMPEGAAEESPAVLRPGVAIPVIGYFFAVASIVGAVVFAVIAHAGKHAPMPPPGDWQAIGDRLLVGEILVVAAWAFYRVGSMRIVLRAASMEIVGFGLKSVVRRNEVADVFLRSDCLVIVLTDGSRIRPAMFWTSGPGRIYFQFGLFRNAMSRTKIRDSILEWRQEPREPDFPSPRNVREYLRHRHWRVRTDLKLLTFSAAMVAVVAVIATAWL